jgi:hypothetical protein
MGVIALHLTLLREVVEAGDTIPGHQEVLVEVPEVLAYITGEQRYREILEEQLVMAPPAKTLLQFMLEAVEAVQEEPRLSTISMEENFQ